MSIFAQSLPEASILNLSLYDKSFRKTHFFLIYYVNNPIVLKLYKGSVVIISGSVQNCEII